MGLQFATPPRRKSALARPIVALAVGGIVLLVVLPWVIGQLNARRGGNAAIDTRLRRAGEADDRLRLTAAQDAASADTAEASPAPDPSVGASAIPAEDRSFEGELAALDWNNVRDDSLFRAAEHATFLGVFAALERVAIDEMPRHSRGRASFAQLYQQSAAYRGRLVTVAGEARRATRIAAPANEQQLTHLEQLWIKPADSNAGPLVVYCLQLPDRFPRGNNLQESVVVHGVFFKRWAYNAQDGTRTAPLLLARSLEWSPGARPAEAAPEFPWITIGISVVALSAVIFTLIWLQESRWKSQRKRRTSTLREAP